MERPDLTKETSKERVFGNRSEVYRPIRKIVTNWHQEPPQIFENEIPSFKGLTPSDGSLPYQEYMVKGAQSQITFSDDGGADYARKERREFRVPPGLIKLIKGGHCTFTFG